MIEVYLTKAIRSFLTDVCKDYALGTEGGETRTPKIVNGYLPYESDSEQDFPFVIVRADSASTDGDMTDVDVDIIIGTYVPDDTHPVGHDVCLEIMARIRTALVGLPEQLLEKRYQLQMPISWDMPAEQPYPYWQLNMSTKWSIHNPRPWSSE